MKTVLIYIGIAYFALLFIAFFLSNHLIFVPPRSSYVDSQDIIKLKTKDNTLIAAIFLPNSKAKYTLLVSHGNAEDIGYLLPLLRAMQAHGFAVFAYDYYGYGLSGGSPNEQNSYLAAETAYEYLVDALQIKPQNILVYGRSLGAAMALDLAVRKPVAALIMESGFVSAFRVMTRIPLLPWDKFNNLQKISKLKVPVLFIHGTKDNIVAFWHSNKLFTAAPKPKEFYEVKNAGHNNVLLLAGEEYWHRIESFVETIK